jgi:hypothetical protein
VAASYSSQIRLADWGQCVLADLDWLGRKRRRSSGQVKLDIVSELIEKALASLEPISFLLSTYEAERDLEKLGNLVDRLLEFDAADFGAWIAVHGVDWIEEKRTALAAVVEVAVQMSAPGIEDLLDRIFSFPNVDPLVISIAAQRIRLLSITDSRTRDRLWSSFKTVIDRWEGLPSNEDALARAVQSLPYVGGTDSMPYLQRMIAKARPRVANSAALAALDWASGNVHGVESLSDAQAQALYESLTDRLNRDRSRSVSSAVDLHATLVWAIGAVAREEHLSAAASLLVASFKKPKGLDDAAALRAARLLVRHYHEKAIMALTKALGGAQSRAFVQFFAALLETSRPR